MAGVLKKIIPGLMLFVLAIVSNSFAEEITLVLSGQTHAMLYPCDCPIEPDGGVARRAAFVSLLRKDNPNILLLDSGSFFAGGVMDPNTQGEDLDKERTRVNLKAMGLMNYDAVTLGYDEFNFGNQFLGDSIAETKIPFLGANMASPKLSAYLVKKFGRAKIGIIGLVNPLAGEKTPGVSFVDYQEALKKAVGQLKKESVDLIILMSGLDETQNQALLKENPEVGIIIEGARFSKEKVAGNYGRVLTLAPRWEGRRMVVASLSVKNKIMEVKKVEDLRMWDKLSDDERMKTIIPQCFSEKDCRKEGMISNCANPGTLNAQCQYKQAPRIELTVITNPDCRTCDTNNLVNSLKREFPGLTVNYLNYPGEKAEKLIGELNLTYLPAYLLDKQSEKEPGFGKLKTNLDFKNGYYLFNAQAAGIGYFLHRQKIAGRLDVFLNIFNKDSAEILDTLKEFSPGVHFLVTGDNEKITSAGGKLEMEENLRSVCVQKYYPGLFYNYISCRAKNPDTSWWDDCLEGVELSAVKTCSQSSQGLDLLKENIFLNRELGINAGPTYLLDNQEIFGSVKVPKKEEFRKLIAR